MPKPPTAAKLLRLIKRHRGNLTAIAEALDPPITRQGAAWHMERLGLLDEAAKARAGAGVKGPRLLLDGTAIEVLGEREQIEAAIAQAGGREGAAAALGMSRRTLYRKLHQYNLMTPKES